MKIVHALAGLLLVAAASGAVSGSGLRAQLRSGSNAGAAAQSDATLPEGVLPNDVFPDARNRLRPIKREDLDEGRRKAYDAAASASPSGVPQGVAAIRLHGSGADVRWAAPVGRRLSELAILTTARELDQPYEWSLHEMEALAVGLEPAIIDVVRNRKPLRGVGEKEAAIIEVGREILGKHKLSPASYARAVKVLGQTDLVDIVLVMAQYTGTATRLTAFNQQMPPQMKQFLPLPFTPPDDIHADSRSRLPLINVQRPEPEALYGRGLGPMGTGPGQFVLHRAGRKTLEAHVGRRLMDLAILVTAREGDQQYDWTMNEIAARNDGLGPAIIDIVRDRTPPAGLGEKEAAITQFGRELFGKHNVTAQTYARALKIFGLEDLVDLVDLMAQHSSDAVLLTAFDQQLPAGQKPLLPVR